MNTRSLSPAGVAVSVATALGFLASAGVIWQSSRAAFFAETSNSGNSWSAGTVTLSDSDSTGSLFNVTGLKSGDTGSACITVGYRGSVDAVVKLYVAGGDLTGTLARYLELTVDQGTPGSFGASCAGFSAAAAIYTGTLDGFAGASTNFSNGVGSWAPTGRSDAAKGYRFTWKLKDDNAAQGMTSTVKFTWEAQST